MKIIKDKIEISELKEICNNSFFVDMVKAVVDIEKEIIAIDAEMHSDLMEFLIEKENSEPKNLWGINLYPEKPIEDFIVFDSMINLKPGLGNKTRGIESEDVKNKIKNIIEKLCKL